MRSIRAMAVVLPLVFCGCAGAPQTHFYILEPQDLQAVEASGAATARGLAIGVETFRVDSPYDQDRIVYRVGEGSTEIGFYEYHRWAAPLERMLPGVIAAVYSGVPGARSIEPMDSRRSYDAVMRGRVVVFEEVDTADGPRVRIQLTLRLDAVDETQLWSATLSRDAGVSSDNVRDVVTQMQSVLAEAAWESRPSLQSALRQQER